MSAKGHKDAAITRPLFEPLTEKHIRADEWSAPLGFVISGLYRRTFDRQSEWDGALSEQYFKAAEALVDAILEQRVSDFQVSNAALFLYRHSFELLLKAGLPAKVRAEKDIHDLGKLARSYSHHKQQAGHAVPAWIIKRCDELAAIDPGSTAFRYGEYGTPKAKNGQPIIDEIHVDLLHLKAAMAALNAALVEQDWLICMARGEAP